MLKKYAFRYILGAALVLVFLGHASELWPLPFVNFVDHYLYDVRMRLAARSDVDTRIVIVDIDENDAFYSFFTPKNQKQPEIHGGFAFSPWCGSTACEEKIKDDLKVTVRCIPFEGTETDGKCVCCGEPAKLKVIFAKSY